MKRVLVPLAQGCEELEAVTVVDLLRRAGIEVVTASLGPGPVHCSRGVTLVADVELDGVLEEAFDMIVLPGGLPGADHLDEDPRIRTLLERIASAGGHVAAICAAPKVLAHAGLLAGRRATAYPGVLEHEGMASTGTAVVRDGGVVTSRGPGTAMDFALELIEILVGRERRLEVEQGLVRDGT